MRLSPTKVAHYAEQLVDVLADTDGVMFDCDDAELHDLLQKNAHYEISMRRVNYDELFKKAKAQEVRRRGLVL